MNPCKIATIFFSVVLSLSMVPNTLGDCVEIDTAAYYNVDMNDTVSAIFHTSFYSDTKIDLINGTLELIIINDKENFSIFAPGSTENDSNFGFYEHVNNKSIPNNGTFQHEYKFNYEKISLEPNQAKITYHKVIIPTIKANTTNEMPMGFLINIPHIRDDFNFSLNIIEKKEKDIQLIMPHDEYNYSVIEFQTLDFQHIYVQNNAVTVIWDGVGDKHRTIGVFYTMHESTSKKKLDEATMVSKGLGVLSVILSLFGLSIILAGIYRKYECTCDDTKEFFIIFSILIITTCLVLLIIFSQTV